MLAGIIQKIVIRNIFDSSVQVHLYQYCIFSAFLTAVTLSISIFCFWRDNFNLIERCSIIEDAPLLWHFYDCLALCASFLVIYCWCFLGPTGISFGQVNWCSCRCFDNGTWIESNTLNYSNNHGLLGTILDFFIIAVFCFYNYMKDISNTICYSRFYLTNYIYYFWTFSTTFGYININYWSWYIELFGPLV